MSAMSFLLLAALRCGWRLSQTSPFQPNDIDIYQVSSVKWQVLVLLVLACPLLHHRRAVISPISTPRLRPLIIVIGSCRPVWRLPECSRRLSGSVPVTEVAVYGSVCTVYCVDDDPSSDQARPSCQIYHICQAVLLIFIFTSPHRTLNLLSVLPCIPWYTHTHIYIYMSPQRWVLWRAANISSDITAQMRTQVPRPVFGTSLPIKPSLLSRDVSVLAEAKLLKLESLFRRPPAPSQHTKV